MGLFPKYADMAGTPSLEHPCKCGSLFDGGAHDIKEIT